MTRGESTKENGRHSATINRRTAASARAESTGDTSLGLVKSVNFVWRPPSEDCDSPVLKTAG